MVESIFSGFQGLNPNLLIPAEAFERTVTSS